MLASCPEMAPSLGLNSAFPEPSAGVTEDGMYWARVVRKGPAGAGMCAECVASCPRLRRTPSAPTLHTQATGGKVRASPDPLGKGEKDWAERSGGWQRGAEVH